MKHWELRVFNKIMFLYYGGFILLCIVICFYLILKVVWNRITSKYASIYCPSNMAIFGSLLCLELDAEIYNERKSSGCALARLETCDTFSEIRTCKNGFRKPIAFGKSVLLWLFAWIVKYKSAEKLWRKVESSATANSTCFSFFDFKWICPNICKIGIDISQ